MGVAVQGKLTRLLIRAFKKNYDSVPELDFSIWYMDFWINGKFCGAPDEGPS